MTIPLPPIPSQKIVGEERMTQQWFAWFNQLYAFLTQTAAGGGGVANFNSTIGTVLPVQGGGKIINSPTISLQTQGITNSFLAPMPASSVKGNSNLTPSVPTDIVGIPNSLLASMPATTLKGNATVSTASPADLTVAQVSTLLNIIYPQVVTYAAANFTAATGTWSPISANQITYSYSLVGKTMTVWFQISGGSLSGTPTNVNISIPGGFVSASQIVNPCLVANNGTFSVSFSQVNSAGTVIQVFANAAGSGTFSTTAAAEGQITFPVN